MVGVVVSIATACSLTSTVVPALTTAAVMFAVATLFSVTSTSR